MVRTACALEGVADQTASTPSEPANALGPPARVSTSYLPPVEAWKDRLSRCPGPHLMLWSEPGRDLGRDPPVCPGGLPWRGPRLGLRVDSLHNQCAGCSFHLDGQGTRVQVVITLLAPGACYSGIWALCREDLGSQCRSILSAELTIQNMHKSKKNNTSARVLASAGSCSFH